MIDFNFYNPANIYFGKESDKELYNILPALGSKNILVVYGGDFVEKLGILDTIKKVGEENNINIYESDQVVPNPRVELVRELIDLAKEKDVDTLIAIGGGSSIDTAKAIAMGVEYDGDIWDFFQGKAVPKKVLPIIAISTIPASGSEVSNATIITNGEYKLGFEDNLLIPTYTIMNPNYVKTLPKYQLSCGILDIYSHLFERYLTDLENVNLTDYMIEGALKSLLVNAEKMIQNPEDIDALSEIMWTATIAHNNLLDSGRVSDWASHRVEHEISGEYDLTHGEGMGIVMIAYCKYIAERKPEKLAQLANRVYGIDYNNFSEREMALMVGGKIRELVLKLGLKDNLSDLNIDDSRFERMAERGTKDDTAPVGHYYPLDKEKFIEVLRLTL